MAGLPIFLTDEQRARVEALRATYGDDPQAVGEADGTEDDFGDLISAVVEALGYDWESDEAAWQRVQEAATGCDAEDLLGWAGVLDLAWKADPALLEQMAASRSATEEAEAFLEHVRAMVGYWAGEDQSNVPEGYGARERLEGLAFSILVALDGGAAVGPYAVRAVADDGTEGPDIAGGLHEGFHTPEMKIKVAGR